MKITGAKPVKQITFKTTEAAMSKAAFRWWTADSKKEKGQQLLASVSFLKEAQSYRFRQAAIFARLYGNMSLFSFMGSSIAKMDVSHGLPIDRPTFNIIQSSVDTLVSRISQSKPAPVFLTDNGDYRQRNLAKKLNNFILGEIYQTKSYDKVSQMLRDSFIEGTGVLKIVETDDKKVGVERILLTELLTDQNESIYGDPRQIYHIKLIDRDILEACWPAFKKLNADTGSAYPDNSADSSKTVSDLVMVVEGWHLPSGKDAHDGRHMIACAGGVIVDEEYTKDKLPFVFLHYSKRLLGFWSQGLAEQLMGTQMEINALLFQISRAIKLVGVPRVFVEKGSKVSKTSFNNEVGSIVEYSGTKPQYEVAPCVPQELYQQLQRLIDYGYQQCGVSAMQASSQKPAGLNSGEAIRSYDDISTDRFASMSKRYDDVFVDLAYLIIDLARDIAIREGSYKTVYPNKNGTKEIDLPHADIAENPIIQCFNMSSLPRDPAGRMQKVTEMIQAGMITIKEGRRLLDAPDLEQVEQLANASEERIYQYLDCIVEDGDYTGPDPFMDLPLAKDIVVQYYNLYAGAKLEEEKCQLLRDFYSQTLDLMTAAQPPAPPAAPGAAPGGAPGASPMAAPQAPPQSPLVPNGAMQ